MCKQEFEKADVIVPSGFCGGLLLRNYFGQENMKNCRDINEEEILVQQNEHLKVNQSNNCKASRRINLKILKFILEADEKISTFRKIYDKIT